MGEEIRYKLRTMMLWALGGFSALFTLPFALAFLWSFPFSRGFVFADIIILAGLLMFGALTLWCCGLAVRKPVALRIDEHGISGYFAPTLAWGDIKWLPQSTGPGDKVIWIDVYDKAAYWSERSLLSRIESALSFQAGMVGIKVNLVKAPADEVLGQMQTMRARFGG